MGFQDFISENEAASLAGITTATLTRFAEAGYLQIENDSDGLRLYNQKEVKDLFGILDRSDRTSIDPEPIESVKSITSMAAKEDKEDGLADSKASSDKEPPHQTEASSEEPETDKSLLSPWEREQSSTSGSAPESETEDSAPQVNSQSTYYAEGIPAQPSLVKEAEISTKLLDQVDKLKRDSHRLQTLVDLQERLLDLKDREIEDLKEQRLWLKSRIEKLEDKAERDQLLLLSETQTIRKLVAYQQERRSPLRAALEWFGFTSPAASQASASNTIELRSRASNAHSNQGAEDQQPRFKDAVGS